MDGLLEGFSVRFANGDSPGLSDDGGTFDFLDQSQVYDVGTVNSQEVLRKQTFELVETQKP